MTQAPSGRVAQRTARVTWDMAMTDALTAIGPAMRSLTRAAPP
jgi:hypothetical protein